MTTEYAIRYRDRAWVSSDQVPRLQDRLKSLKFRPVCHAKTQVLYRRLTIPVSLSLPQQWTIVFDINGVLGRKVYDCQTPQFSHIREGKVDIILRPGAKKLVTTLKRAGHRVIVWSSMTRRVVQRVASFVNADAWMGNEDSPRNETNPEMHGGRNCAILKPLAKLTQSEHALIVEDDPHKLVASDKQEKWIRPPPCFSTMSEWSKDDGCHQILCLIAERIHGRA